MSQLQRSHAPGDERERALQGATIHHEMVRASNARWLLELLRALPRAAAARAAEAADANAGVLRPAELRTLAERLVPWWL